uniref:Ribosomal protein L23 n=2 Tax=Selaginella TaxID=3246 RepID=A0A7U3W2R5_9TRAC|nr:ribosomal protein L23 [Selaginella nipponica]QQP00340.1 ribosomal protein L23 [Selaginella pallidissima]QQP00260.1 ribosomal protein L23 [Selaginella nipponica]QQP00287.1 ribosomal protein L23 [Selaginella nipponica]QQP00354.1 ribosomal protein L23 [Selaginella pallidissima]
MGGVENPVSTDKAIRSLERKQYSSNAEPNPSKTEMKRRIEQFPRVRIVAINSHRLPAVGRGSAGSVTERRVRRKRTITTLQLNHPIPLFPGK